MGRRSKQYSHCVPRRWAANQYPFADDPARGMAEHWCGSTRVWEREKPFESVQEAQQAKLDRKERERLEAIEREAARATAAKEREEREAVRLERLATWREALASLDGRADLTNLERAGLEAIKLLYP